MAGLTGKIDEQADVEAGPERMQNFHGGFHHRSGCLFVHELCVHIRDIGEISG
jgi:hypothetical protein